MAECDAVHVQGTTSALPAPITVPATTAAAFVDEDANRARTSYPASSPNNPADSSLLTATSLNPNSTTATPPQRSITMTISLPTTLHWTDHEPWVDGRCAQCGLDPSAFDLGNLNSNATHRVKQHGRRIAGYCALTLGGGGSVDTVQAIATRSRESANAVTQRRQPASQVASGSGSDGSILARPCSAIYILCAVIVRMAMCTAFEVAEIVVDEWDIAIASSASSSRIFIIFLRSMRPSALPRKRSGCAPHTAGGASPTAIQIQRLEAQLPAMARSGNGADAAAVRLLASGSGARGLSFACRYGEYRV